MVERQTKENLQKVMEEELRLVGVSLEQVVTITHDNGANMIASVKCLKALLSHRETEDGESLSTHFRCAEDTLQFLTESNDSSTDDDEIDDEDVHPDTAGPDEPLSDDFVEGDGSDDFSVDDSSEDEQMDLLESIRCGAHTAQLAVWDVIKPYKQRLNEINKICIKMRHKEFEKLFKCYKIPLPPKVNETRWNVWYLLLKYVQSLKDEPILTMLKSQNPTLGIFNLA